MTLCKRILFIGLSMFTVAAMAVEPQSSDDLAAELLRKQLNAMNSLRGNFEQTTFDQQGVEQEKSRGEFMLMRPGKFYWKTIEPMAQLLVSNNKTIWLYDPDLETVNQREFTDDLRETPALLLSADIAQLRKNFSVTRSLTPSSSEDTKTSKATNVETYRLTPKVTKGLFQYLTLVFESDQLTEFSLKDSLGQITLCELTDVERNVSLPEEKFYFIPPQGVEVLTD